jgi:outer membrane lipoprotein-sorting protein
MFFLNHLIKYFFLSLSIAFFLFNNQSFGSEANQIEKIEDYLNGIQSLEADILQTDPYGTQKLGIIKLKKPGKLRIEYKNQKADHLILASHGILAIIDYGSNAEPLRYPINKTPLKYLSNNELDLLDPLISSRISTLENQISLEITEIDKDFGSGRIILKFAADPISIIGWDIPLNDKQKTEIKLKNLRLNSDIKDDLFYVSAELMKFYNKINE